MSRDDHVRAKQLVRLRDLTLDAALRTLSEAQAAMADAEAAVFAAESARDISSRRVAAARAALVAAPVDVPTRLALIDLAVLRDGEAADALEEAEAAREQAEAALDVARIELRQAQARLEAMTARADDLGRGIARADEERAAIEAEEGMLAMRSAA